LLLGLNLKMQEAWRKKKIRSRVNVQGRPQGRKRNKPLKEGHRDRGAVVDCTRQNDSI